MKVSFTLSKADRKQACRVMYKLQPKTSLLRIVNFCGSFFGTFLLFASSIPLIRILYDRASTEADIIYCLVGLALGILALISRRYLVTKIALNSSGIFGCTYSYEALEDRLVCLKNGNIRTEIYPSAINKIISSDGFVFIFTGKNYAYFIPVASFTTNSALSEFLKMLEKIKGQTYNNDESLMYHAPEYPRDEKSRYTK